VRRGSWRGLCLLGLLLELCSHTPRALGQLSTEDHLAEPGFWPTKDQDSREAFLGTEACARCHGAKVSSQKETPMARNLMPAATADILHSHPALSFTAGNVQYHVDHRANESLYSVTDGNQKLAYLLSWAFGTGRVAQSYLFKKEDDSYYEARVTYFVSLGTIDFTPFRTLLTPSSIEEAMYRPVGQTEVQRCFACHATASSIGGHFDERHLILGVTCEACHGPGASHVIAMDDLIAGKPEASKTPIFNSAHLSPTDAVDFCGACHSSWWDVKLSGAKGVSTARSAPYRLVTSKCWGKGDARLTCTACHDPHEQLQTDAAAYDKNCLSCHVNSPGAKPTATHPGAACPTAVKNCTSCHMPKAYVPEMHADFTDHRIRIAKPGEPFPD
jgi:hypothetical protein